MPLPWSVEWAGRIEERWIESAVLRDNPLGDPFERPLWVYLPPGYDVDLERRYPAVYQLQGMTGQLCLSSEKTGSRSLRQSPPSPHLRATITCWPPRD